VKFVKKSSQDSEASSGVFESEIDTYIIYFKEIRILRDFTHYVQVSDIITWIYQ